MYKPWKKYFSIQSVYIYMSNSFSDTIETVKKSIGEHVIVNEDGTSSSASSHIFRHFVGNLAEKAKEEVIAHIHHQPQQNVETAVDGSCRLTQAVAGALYGIGAELIIGGTALENLATRVSAH